MFQVNECEVLVDGKRKEKASPRGKMGQDRGMDTEGSIQQDLLLMLESGKWALCPAGPAQPQDVGQA